MNKALPCADYYPLTVTFGRRNLCHIETDAGAAVGQGVAICSVPRKHQAIAEAMVNAFNEYHCVDVARRTD